MRSVKRNTRALLALGLLLPAIAMASEALPPPAPITDVPAAHSGDPATARPAPPPASFGGLGQNLAPEELEQYRGGSATIHSEAVSNGLLQNATATKVATGNNSIADGAFTNAIGLPIVIQNSGANVLIQNSTIVNVQFR